mgnify:CR=1 FL=1
MFNRSCRKYMHDKGKVNGLETDITFWIAKPTDWI